MYHYSESGLQNVWLKNGYVIHRTPYGKGVAIEDVAGLHKAICVEIARRPKLTGAELRFIRTEMGMSQAALALLLGTSEQNISLWERRGKIPKTPDRLVKLICLEYMKEDVQVRGLIDKINAQDAKAQEDITFEKKAKIWKEAA